MFDASISAIAARLINHLLQSASWATDRLQAHAGKSFRVRAPLNSLHLKVAADGLLQAAPAEAAPEVSITLSAGQWLRLMARDKTALKDASIEGDAEFAAALSYLAEHLAWDYEEDLSRVLGDVAAHRIAGGLRQAQIWRKDAAASTAETMKEYLTEERPMIAKREAVEQFAREVDTLRDDVERLSKRIDKL
jgi:ubiquinone biosynthesis accessory factor UbiJ